MKGIKVYMLGRFEIVADGNEVVKNLGSSKKRITLLEYLILNKDKTILMKELFEVLWPGENSSNPESALKTLVSRLRATLSTYSPLLEDCIMTDRGGYRWNTHLDCEIDIFEMEKLCREILSAREYAPSMHNTMARIMDMYAGELLPSSDMESWVATKSVYFHDIYLSSVRHYIELVKPLEQYDEIVQVCRMALDVDAFDTELNLELMSALLKAGRNNEALTQYNHATDMRHEQHGSQQPDGMLDFYKKLISIDVATEADIKSISSELRLGDKREGAFVCDYMIFKDIYDLNMRNISRMGGTMFIALITLSSIDEAKVEPLLLEKLMQILLESLQENLRRGDTISRYDTTKYAVLLPCVSYEMGRVPLERVKKAFYKQYTNPGVIINYKLAPIEND